MLTSVPGGRPRTVAISAAVKPPSTIKVVSGVTNGLPAGALRRPLNGSLVSKLMPPLTVMTSAQEGLKVKSPVSLVVAIAPPQEAVPPKI